MICRGGCTHTGNIQAPTRLMKAATVLATMRPAGFHLEYADLSRQPVAGGVSKELHSDRFGNGYKKAGRGGAKRKDGRIHQPRSRRGSAEEDQGVFLDEEEFRKFDLGKISIAIKELVVVEVDDEELVAMGEELIVLNESLIRRFEKIKGGDDEDFASWDERIGHWWDKNSAWWQYYHELDRQKKHDAKIVKQGFDPNCKLGAKARREMRKEKNQASEEKPAEGDCLRKFKIMARNKLSKQAKRQGLLSDIASVVASDHDSEEHDVVHLRKCRADLAAIQAEEDPSLVLQEFGSYLRAKKWREQFDLVSWKMRYFVDSCNAEEWAQLNDERSDLIGQLPDLQFFLQEERARIESYKREIKRLNWRQEDLAKLKNRLQLLRSIFPRLGTTEDPNFLYVQKMFDETDARVNAIWDLSDESEFASVAGPLKLIDPWLSQIQTRIKDLEELRLPIEEACAQGDIEAYASGVDTLKQELLSTYRSVCCKVCLIPAAYFDWDGAIAGCKEKIKRIDIVRERITGLEQLKGQISEIQNIASLLGESHPDFAAIEAGFAREFNEQLFENLYSFEDGKSFEDGESAFLKPKSEEVACCIVRVKQRIRELQELKQRVDEIERACLVVSDYTEALVLLKDELKKAYHYMITLIYQSDNQFWGQRKAQCDQLATRIMVIRERVKAFEEYNQQVAEIRGLSVSIEAGPKDFVSANQPRIEMKYACDIAATMGKALYAADDFEKWAEVVEQSRSIIAFAPKFAERVAYIKTLQLFLAEIEEFCGEKKERVGCFADIKEHLMRLYQQMVGTVYSSGSCGVIENDTWLTWRQACELSKTRYTVGRRRVQGLELLKPKIDSVRIPSMKDALRPLRKSMFDDSRLFLELTPDGEWDRKFELLSTLVDLAVAASVEEGREAKTAEFDEKIKTFSDSSVADDLSSALAQLAMADGAES